jgi:hypothetical protein
MATATIYAPQSTNFWARQVAVANWNDKTNLDDWQDQFTNDFFIGGFNSKGFYGSQRFESFNVSSLSGAVVSAASIQYTSQYGDIGSAQSYHALKYSWADGSPSTRTSNYRIPTELQALTSYGQSDSAYRAAGGMLTITDTSTLRTDISAGGTLKMVVASLDNINNTVTGGFIYVYSADTATITNRPKLIVTYTPSAGPSYSLIVSPL